MKKTFSNKDIAIIVTLVLIFYAFKFLLPLLIIVGIYFYIKNKHKPVIEEKPKQRPPIQIEDNREMMQATLQECEEVIRSDRQIRNETDLRQFQGRTNVTKEELATYMFEQRYWDGVYERHIQMEEIIKNCNLTEMDIGWVEQELKHYHPYRKGTYLGDMNKDNQNFTFDNRICTVRSEENKAIWEYQNEKDRAETRKRIQTLVSDRQKEVTLLKNTGTYNKDYEKQFDDKLKQSLLYAMQDLRRCDYEAWLKMKGYVK